MNNSIKLEIDKQLNIQPYRINSNLVSACERDRYYWTNIKNVGLPKDKGILLKYILQNEDEIAEKYYYKENYTFHGWDKTICATLHINGNDIIKRVNNPEFKCHTLTAVCGGNHQKKVLINGRVRKLTPIEYERCMTLPDGYSNIVADTHRYRGLGNGWTAEIIIHILKNMNIPKDENLLVLSLYDGIGTGRYCLDKLNYNNIKYYSYEIDKNAVKIANYNYPDIIQMGDAFQIRNEDWMIR